jgi:DNA-binding NarL/FixJ family response regulator
MNFTNPTHLTPAQAVTAAKKKRVVVIEDQRVMAEFLSAHCTRFGLEVSALCLNGADGLKAISTYRPELVLLDISLPDGDGLEIAKRIKVLSPGSKILAISSHRDPWTMLQVQRVGLHGFVDKTDQKPDVISEAIDAVLAGRIYYTPVVHESSASIRRDPKAFIRVLSDYETQILSLIGRSMTDDEISVVLGISPSTVQSRRRDIMRKLDIHSTPKLIHYAITNGLTRTEHLDSDPSKACGAGD